MNDKLKLALAAIELMRELFAEYEKRFVDSIEFTQEEKATLLEYLQETRS